MFFIINKYSGCVIRRFFSSNVFPKLLKNPSKYGKLKRRRKVNWSTINDANILYSEFTNVLNQKYFFDVLWLSWYKEFSKNIFELT